MLTPAEKFEKSITKDNLWLYIFMLLKKKELYPYEIREEIKRNFGFSAGNMTAYVVLKKLNVYIIDTKSFNTINILNV